MKKYIKWTLIIVLLSSFSPNIQSQSYHEKYWWYRYRFRQYFTDIGEGEGKSLVASRHKWKGSNISLSDQTIKLAWYMGILALESYQLEYEHDELDDMTLTELYYAILAYERLDMCEDKAPWYQSAEHDGFFMRHDVALTDGTYEEVDEDGNFSFNFDMSNYNYGIDPSVNEFNKTAPGMPFYVDRFWRFKEGQETNYEEQKSEEMSIDQAAALLMGFSLVKRFLPSGNVAFKNTETGINMTFDFIQRAKTNALKIAEHMRDGYTDGFELLDQDYNWAWLIAISTLIPLTPHPELYGVENWATKNPHGDKVGRDGWNARVVRYGVKKAIEEITGNYFSEETGSGEHLWDFIAASQDWEIFPGPYHSRIILANLAIVGDSWNHELLWGLLTARRTPGVVERLLKKSNSVEDNDANTVYPGIRTDHELLYVLLWSALHITSWEDNFDNIQDNSYMHRIRTILDSAPLCGPYNYSEEGDGVEQDIPFNFTGCDNCLLPNMAPSGWRASNRFQNVPYEFKKGRNDSHAVYNGNDYMMLYLLYRKYIMWQIGGHNGYAYIRNMIYSEIEQSYPYEDAGTDFGTINNPANLRAFETIKYNGQIGSESNEDGSLNLIAGKNISLTPGFHVYPGSTFSAKIEEYNCFEVSNNKSSFVDNNYIKPKNNNIGAMYQSVSGFKTNSSTYIEENASDIFIYPNPANTEITISSNNALENLVYRVYNQQGQFLYSGKLSIGNAIKVADLPNGLYFIEAINDNGIIIKEKFIVNH